MKRWSKIILMLFVMAILFSIFSFAIPFPKNSGFFVAYIAELVAIFLQIPIFNTALGRDGSVDSKFLGYPTVKIGCIYLIVQTIASVLIFSGGFFRSFPSWISVVVCGVILCLAIIGCIGTEIAENKVGNVEDQGADSTKMIDKMRVISSSLPPMINNDSELGRQLTALDDDLHFSDPVSVPATSDIEQEIFSMLTKLKSDIVSDNITETSVIEVRRKLAERNALCRNSK